MIIEDKSNASIESCFSIIQKNTPKMYIDKDSNGKFIQKYHIHSIFELFSLDTYMYMNSSSESKICLCKLCGRYFIKNKRNTEVSCQYPNPHFNGKTCTEYHNENPSYIDPISKIVSNAIKAQNKYYNDYIDVSDNEHSIWHKWTYELRKREKKARITKDIAHL